jgi:hypothetical protein
VAADTGHPSPADPLVDACSVGLRMFNLGTIPASVTPPRSWRRAAWFTIVASIASLAGLLAVAAVLVGPVQPIDRLNALPYFPDGSPLATLGGPADPVGHSLHHTAGTNPARAMTDEVADVDHTQSLDRIVGTRPQGESATASVDTTGVPSVTSTTTQQPPSVTIGHPIVDPSTLVDRTKSFFSDVTSNVKAAAALTVGSIQDDAAALIQQKYGDVSSIQIERMSLDPTSGLTISLLRLVNKDGTTQTQHITLQFTLTGDPKITNPGG